MPRLCYESFNSLSIFDFDNQCYCHNGDLVTKSQEDSLTFNIHQNICELFTNHHDNVEFQAQLAGSGT